MKNTLILKSIWTCFNNNLSGSVLTTAMYASPLSVMWEVIRTKSVEFMPLPLSAMTFVNCTVWTAYSFYVQDVYLGVPNALGVVLSTAQVCFI